jgi:dTDP-4-dehydrorhamnose 3,5-epimerase
MRFEATQLPGCFLVHGGRSGDSRGSFTKTFHFDSFAAAGLRTDWREAYCSTSARSVIRGMHFQLPPADHAKLVFCTAGQVRDVVLDLRRGSPTYGEHRAFDLDEEAGVGVYIPSGCAHGFLSLSASSTMYYNVTSVHSPAHDSGISWDSFGLDWPVAAPILSERDRRHPPLAQFQSPFHFDPAAPAR